MEEPINHSDRPILWGRGSSTNVQKVIWTSVELGLDVDHRPLAGEFGGNTEDWFLELNPNGTVPVWQDGEFVLYESQAILRYLARKYGALYGSDARETAQVDCWLDWFALVFWPPVRMLFLDVVRDKKRQLRDPEAQAALRKTEKTVQIVTERLLKNEHLAGPNFTIADISMTIGMNRLIGMDVGISLHHHLKMWLDEKRAREGFQKAAAHEPAMTGGH